MDENLKVEDPVVAEDMDLTQFLRGGAQMTSAASANEPVDIAIAQGDEIDTASEATNEVSLSPAASNAKDLAEKMKREAAERMEKAAAAARHKQTGALVDAAKDTNKIEPLRSVYQSDQKINEFNEAMDESNHDVEVISKVYVVKKPSNPVEEAAMMTEVAATTIDPETGLAIVPEGSIYLVAKTPELEEKYKKIKEKLENGEELTEEEMGTAEPLRENAGYKNSLVRILIDKTGCGADIKFDDEESRAIKRAEMIELVEVENQELETFDTVRADEDLPFADLVQQYQLAVAKAPMTFTASGFRADMCSFNWSEFYDIYYDTRRDDAIYDFDQMNKRLTIIYNLMKNVSTGEFADYDDFLKNFAFVDSDLGIFGLLVATVPEIDELPLTCTRNDCRKPFRWKYSPRSIIDFNRMDTDYLELMEKINQAGPGERMKYYNNSAVKSIKRLRLPNSKAVVEVSIASSYDHLYQIIPAVHFINEHYPELDSREAIINLLDIVRGVRIRMKSGKMMYITKGTQIVEAIVTMLPIPDVEILAALYDKLVSKYTVHFSLKDLVCPHCNRKTARLPIRPDDVVFLLMRRQEGTRVTFDSKRDGLTN